MDEAYAYFRVFGPGNYQKVSEILGIQPSKAFSEGDSRPRGGKYKNMNWELDSGLSKKGTIHEILEKHIDAILNKVEDIENNLTKLDDCYTAYIQCVGYYHGANPGFGISKELVSRAAKLNLGFDFDIYSVSEEE